MVTEQYLFDDYDLFEDAKYLTKEEDIIPYFKDWGREFFDCGQGYYQEYAELFVKVEDKFYNVLIHANIESAKQDMGDRLYWVEDITKVEFEEVDNPAPKKEKRITLTFYTNEDKLNKVISILEKNKIGYILEKV